MSVRITAENPNANGGTLDDPLSLAVDDHKGPFIVWDNSEMADIANPIPVCSAAFLRNAVRALETYEAEQAVAAKAKQKRERAKAARDAATEPYQI